MTEKMPTFDASIIRHSSSVYKTYAEATVSEDPQAPFDPGKRATSEISEKGMALAKIEAEKFFERINPVETALFFVSSNETRAIETANVYRLAAKEKGIEILDPGNIRDDLASDIGGGEIRTVDALSVNPKNVLLSTVFNPEAYLRPVNWDAVDEETKEKWQQARNVINSDDKGGWGANFKAHSESIKEIFPEIQSAEDLFEGKFKNILRLVKWASHKVAASGVSKNIKVLGFGHEDSLMVALERYFEEEGISNCEPITFTVTENDSVVGEYRGKEAGVE